jgi:hypothetical protein
MKPRAKSGLLSQPLDDELILYDQSRDRGHCLNRTAALVWQLSDGGHSIPDIAAILRTELDPAADENLVWHTLDHLNAVHLLETPSPRPIDEMRASRRQFIAKVGLVGVASLLLPVVTSVATPAAAETVSCGSSGGFGMLQAEWLKTK